MAKYYRNKENIIFETIVIIFVVLVLVICLVPFIYVISVSFSGPGPLTKGEVFLFGAFPAREICPPKAFWPAVCAAAEICVY